MLSVALIPPHVLNSMDHVVLISCYSIKYLQSIEKYLPIAFFYLIVYKLLYFPDIVIRRGLIFFYSFLMAYLIKVLGTDFKKPFMSIIIRRKDDRV